MTRIIEDLAMILAFDEARKMLEPKNYWPTDEDGAMVAFAGRALTQDDLADMVFYKHQDALLAEAAKILESRTTRLASLSFNSETV